jgi:arylsulfatase A-like enzyme
MRLPPLRCFLLILAFCCASATLNPHFARAQQNPKQQSAETQHPNVVMIISDDQAWGDYSFMGHAAIQTPNLDKLAAESLTFTRGYVPDSLCRPSLVSIISGLYPHQHGIVGNDPPRPETVPPAARNGHSHPAYLPVRAAYIDKIDPIDTFPEMLAPLGYRSHQSGKWWEGNYRRGGFTDGMTHGDLARGARHGDEGLTIGREGLQPIKTFLDDATEHQQPFFLWYAPFLPHTPHTPPARLLEKYTAKTDSLPIAKYWAMCEWFDETCGQLITELETRGLRDNTIIVYVTDNGWINEPTASRYAPRSKRSPNEGGTRTPIMVNWPGKIAPQLNTKDLASSIDLVPTLRAALQLPAMESLPGINLMDASSVANRKSVFGEIFEHDIVDMEDEAASLMYRWVIDGDWKLIQPYEVRFPDKKPELYNVTEDPSEMHNLADKHPDRVKALRASLDAWWAP